MRPPVAGFEGRWRPGRAQFSRLLEKVDDWPQFCSEICDVPNDRVQEQFLPAIPIFWRRGMARGAPSPTGSEKPTSAVQNRSRKGSFRAPHISLEKVDDWPQFCSEICDAPNGRAQEQFLTVIPIFRRRGMARSRAEPDRLWKTHKRRSKPIPGGVISGSAYFAGKSGRLATVLLRNLRRPKWSRPRAVSNGDSDFPTARNGPITRRARPALENPQTPFKTDPGRGHFGLRIFRWKKWTIGHSFAPKSATSQMIAPKSSF